MGPCTSETLCRFIFMTREILNIYFSSLFTLAAMNIILSNSVGNRVVYRKFSEIEDTFSDILKYSGML